MEKNKDLSIINCIATAMIAYFFMIPLHELFHLLTFYAYGDKCYLISAYNVKPMELIDYNALPAFHRILVTGGSASILNAIIGIVLLFILLKAKMGPMVRLFLVQYMGLHMAEGFGYMMLGGMMLFGDWGNVFSHFTDNPALVNTLRIILAIIGSIGAVALFFILNYMSYYFIEDTSNPKERRKVAAKLHLSPFFVGVFALLASFSQNPSIKDGSLSLPMNMISCFMFLGFIWAFFFTGFWVKPPKESRFLYRLPERPNWILFILGIILILINTFVLGPGIKLN